MSFTSVYYVLCLAVIALLGYILPVRARNVLLLAAGYGFYALYGPENLPFLLFSTLVSYFAARLIEKTPPRFRKLTLVSALVLNLGLLAVFKYLGFFFELATQLFPLPAPAQDSVLANLIVPVGISFFVFQTAGYLIDVYRGDMPAERNFINFALFASFFPGLLSGPIQRSRDMLPQYKRKNAFFYENIKAGALQFLWGAFKKMVVADRLAVVVNSAYAAVGEHSGYQLAFAAVCYSIQIYCDFSAYSDMAIGSARIMGFFLRKNFDCPYFATSLRDFWKGWHISLTSWFRDYLYFPLGGSRKGKWRGYLNIIIVFLVSGLWHGAAMTFVVWGLLHGVLQVAAKLLEKPRAAARKALHISDGSLILAFFRWALTFAIVTVAWIFFRAGSVSQAAEIISRIFTDFSPIGGLSALGLAGPELYATLIFTLFIFAADLLQKKTHLSQRLRHTVFARYAVSFVLLCVIIIFGSYGTGYDPMAFVYFKF
ncbi:MAG: MBOAT family protein [Clostridia bacterium]|nr:MBOAT family protein [Clostridia bacterium]